jgi:hypothetical protein
MRAKLVAEGTPHIDFFPVLAVEANELIVGANDSHLDFRLPWCIVSVARRRPIKRGGAGFRGALP